MAVLVLVGSLCGEEWNWRQLSTNAPPTVAFHTRVFWTGWELLVWGTESRASDGRYVPQGWRWNARHGLIRPLPLENAPPWPDGQTAVWTGRYLAVWGGRRTSDPTSDTNDGYLYDPVGDRWLRMSSANAPSARSRHGAVWTGREMIIWGGSRTRREGAGYAVVFPEDFGAYDPGTDTWRGLAAAGGPVGRDDPHLAWTGSELLVWGGLRLEGGWSDLHNVYFSALFRYDPATSRWVQSVAAGAPSGRADHAAVWTGTEWVIWGGYNGRTYGNRVLLGDGARYVPSRDQWLPLATSGSPGARERSVAVWTGREVLLWCGAQPPLVGACYIPAADAWGPLPTTGAPGSLEAGNAAWTGEDLLAVGDDVFALGRAGPYRGDLVPDDWQELHFGRANPAAAGDLDPDGDGWINRHEWLHGTDPLDPASHPQIVLAFAPGGVEVLLPGVHPLLRYGLSQAEVLPRWGLAAEGVAQPGEGFIRWATAPAAGPGRFFRLEVADPEF